MITAFVFAAMVFVDYINVATGGKIDLWIRGGSLRQYIIASLLGVAPGCLGAFMNVTFYVHGLLSFGALAGGMIATTGDAAFIMLAQMPAKAILLFGVLFSLGIIWAWVFDKISPHTWIVSHVSGCEIQKFHIGEECRILNLQGIIDNFKEISFVRFLLLGFLGVFIGLIASGVIGPGDWGWERITLLSCLGITLGIVITVGEHYLEEHIWKHVAKRHICRIFLWIFLFLLVINLCLETFDLKGFIEDHLLWVLLFASLVAIIPDSGPHFIFIFMFNEGVIPFSVLLANSIIQDGHGMLPLLSYTVRGVMFIKAVKFALGLSIGLVLYSLGL
jgi:hypothetical protein